MQKQTKKLLAKIFEVLNPPPNISLSNWADNYRRLSQEASAEPGQWNTDRAPYQREIMDAITDIAIHKVVVMSAAQIGKTDAFILNPIGYYMHYDPSPIMVLQPTITMAETFSKDRLTPMLRDTPVLQDKVNEGKRSGCTILQKIFPGGHVTMVGSNSPQSLASRPIRILLCDEIDRYPATAGKEGDPLVLAGKRQTTFWNKKEVDISTPTIAGMSRIELEYLHSSKGEWNVPCPHCGELQPLIWANVKFNKNDLSNIEYVCEKCGTVANEVEWKENFINGKFIHEFPDNPVKGYHLNSLASKFVEWRDVVEKFIKATEEVKKGNIELLKAWTNTEMGQTWEEQGEQIETESLRDRAETYNCEIPDRVIALTAAVDVQDNRFEIEVVGWGEEKESWGIKYHRIYGDLKLDTIWSELDSFLDQTFFKNDGTQLKILCTCIDSGGHFTDEVYRFCKGKIARRIFAIKGKGGTGPYISAPSKNNRYKTPLFTIGVDTGKSLLHERLKLTTPGPGYCHFPKEPEKGYDDMYFKMLTAEKQVLQYKNGKAFYCWVFKDNSFKRNEAWDIRNYAIVALEIANPVLKLEEKVVTTTSKHHGRRVRNTGVKI